MPLVTIIECNPLIHNWVVICAVCITKSPSNHALIFIVKNVMRIHHLDICGSKELIVCSRQFRNATASLIEFAQGCRDHH